MTLSDLLDNLTSDLANEWVHLHFYLYHASAVRGPHAAEYREFFTEAAQGEMQHIQQFLDRLFGLNHPQPYRPANKTFAPQTEINAVLRGAIDLESTVIQNYAQRLSELENFEGDPVIAAYFKVFYEKQLEDSYEDREKMRRMLDVLPA
jgi:bacterioferritin (cytochrome b1)